MGLHRLVFFCGRLLILELLSPTFRTHEATCRVAGIVYSLAQTTVFVFHSQSHDYVRTL